MLVLDAASFFNFLSFTQESTYHHYTYAIMLHYKLHIALTAQPIGNVRMKPSFHIVIFLHSLRLRSIVEMIQ